MRDKLLNNIAHIPWQSFLLAVFLAEVMIIRATSNNNLQCKICCTNKLYGNVARPCFFDYDSIARALIASLLRVSFVTTRK